MMTRRRTTDTCAIVNDSSAPNEYTLPRNVAWPGSVTRMANRLKTMIPIHGVRKRGCNRRSASGIWRWMPIEYTSREMPMSPAFVARNRIVAASRPT